MDEVRQDVGERPVLLTTRYEPRPFWHYLGRKWFIAIYFRPADVGAGIQFMWGGIAFICWPLLLAVCNHHKMPSGPKSHAPHPTLPEQLPEDGITIGEEG